MLKITELSQAKRDLKKAPQEIIKSYEIWARLIEEHGLPILREFKGYHDEKLKGENIGLRSSRLNRQWRVIYGISKNNKVSVVSIHRVTPHDYRVKK